MSTAGCSRYGYAMPNPGTRVPLADRLWARVDRRGPDDCWLWTGPPTKRGSYGQINRGGREGPVPTHVAAYEVTFGPVPYGFDVHHTCRVRLCCNPAHLELQEHTEHGRLHATEKRTRCRLRDHDLTDPANVMPDGRRCRACRRAVAAAHRAGA